MAEMYHQHVSRLLSAADDGDIVAFERHLMAARGLAGVDSADPYGITPLFAAARNGHLAFVRRLVLHYHAYVNCRTTLAGATPLMIAATYGRAAVCQFLVEHGADVRVVDKDTGRNVLQTEVWKPERRRGCDNTQQVRAALLAGARRLAELKRTRHMLLKLTGLPPLFCDVVLEYEHGYVCTQPVRCESVDSMISPAAAAAARRTSLKVMSTSSGARVVRRDQRRSMSSGAALPGSTSIPSVTEHDSSKHTSNTMSAVSNPANIAPSPKSMSESRRSLMALTSPVIDEEPQGFWAITEADAIVQAAHEASQAARDAAEAKSAAERRRNQSGAGASNNNDNNSGAHRRGLSNNLIADSIKNNALKRVSQPEPVSPGGSVDGRSRPPSADGRPGGGGANGTDTGGGGGRRSPSQQKSLSGLLSRLLTPNSIDQLDPTDGPVGRSAGQSGTDQKKVLRERGSSDNSIHNIGANDSAAGTRSRQASIHSMPGVPDHVASTVDDAHAGSKDSPHNSTNNGNATTMDHVSPTHHNEISVTNRTSRTKDDAPTSSSSSSSSSCCVIC